MHSALCSLSDGDVNNMLLNSIDVSMWLHNPVQVSFCEVNINGSRGKTIRSNCYRDKGSAAPKGKTTDQEERGGGRELRLNSNVME